ncbi:MAG: carboxymuconolactone decarboxylase family protein [Paracoccus sp. (in: a-proteobacteria)]|nr:carboxymuconolactone decarboxylase family protein [Paracoccus sp. (in: a-proteobacteria)]
MTDAVADLAAAKTRLGQFAKSAPALMQGFAAISRQATTARAFSAAQKELMTVAIAVVKGCDDCILYHLDAARRYGATESDLLEVLAIAVEMGGGPAIMYSGRALEAFRKLA